MTLKAWAVKPGELRRLTRGPRLVWAARCAMRVEAWRPPGVEADWDAGLARVVAAVAAAPGNVEVAALARALNDRGARASNQRDGTADEAVGRCMNYATQALAGALAATAVADGPALAKAVIDVAKLAGSIPAVLAPSRSQLCMPRSSRSASRRARTSATLIGNDLVSCRWVLRSGWSGVVTISLVSPCWGRPFVCATRAFAVGRTLHSPPARAHRRNPNRTTSSPPLLDDRSATR